MSRSGYTDDYDENYNLYRGTVTRAIGGRRGQQALRDFVAELDTMPEKRLAANSFETKAGEVCSLGALAHARGVDVSDLDREADDYYGIDADVVAGRLNIAECMAREVMYYNDESGHHAETPESRWLRMRTWAVERIHDGAP